MATFAQGKGLNFISLLHEPSIHTGGFKKCYIIHKTHR